MKPPVLPFSLVLVLHLELAWAAEWQDYDPVPRWGQSSSLAQNQWLIYGGKTNPDGGQSHDSAPNSNDLLSLDLTDDSPSWRIWSDTPDSAPEATYQTLSILSSNTSSYAALLFGGDVTGTSLPTGTDSSFLLTLPAAFSSASSSSNKQISWQHPSSDWVDQPMRRIKAATASIADSQWVYNYVFGGLKNDDSIGFNELWCFRGNSADLSDPSWQQLSAQSTSPPVAYGHTMTLLSDGQDFRVVVLGGQNDYTSLNSLDEIYIFTPGSSDRCSGSWTTVTPDGDTPTDRQGHVAVALSSTEILIHGGASADETSVYEDLATLTFNDDWTTATWNVVDAGSSDNGPGARYQHSAVKSESQVLFAFGYSESNGASVSSPGYAIYSTDDKTWKSSYKPASKASSDSNPSSGISSGHSGGSTSGSNTSNSDSTTSDSNGNGDDHSSDSQAGDNRNSNSSGSDGNSSNSSDSSGSSQDSNNGSSGQSESGSDDNGDTLHTPGVDDAPTDSDGSSGSNGNGSGGASEDKNKEHTGVILGSVMSVFVVGLLAAGWIYWHRRKQRQTAAYCSDGRGGRYGEGFAGLIGGADDDGFEKASPAVMKGVGPEGVKGAAKSALASALGVARRVPAKGGHRWDMLADEESNYSQRTPSQRSGSTLRGWPSGRRHASAGWQEAPLAEPVPEEMRQLATAHDEAEAAISESNRTGLQIWDGVYGPAFTKAQASKSYMSHALGPWLGRASSTGGSTRDDLDLHDLPNDPFEDPAKLGALRSPTRPAGPRWPSAHYSDPFQSNEDDIASSNDHHTTEESYGVASSSAPSTTLTSEQSFTADSKSGKPFAAALRQDTPSPTGFSANPSLSGSSFAPLFGSQSYAPLKRTSTWWGRFGAGVHSSVVASPSSSAPIRDTAPPPLQSIAETSDPFADDCQVDEEEQVRGTSDEQGRKPPGTSSAYQTRQTPSHTSETSTGTVMLDRVASMQVVQHSRYGTGSQSSASVHSPMTEEGETFSPMTSPILDEATSAALVRTASSIKRPTRARRMTAGTTGVKQMIAEIEERQSSPTPTASPHASPRKKRPHQGKVEVGFAPKPYLVLANPD